MPKCSSRGAPPLEHLLGHLDDRALDAAAGHRARHLAARVDRHLRARRPRRRALDVDDGRERDARRRATSTRPRPRARPSSSFALPPAARPAPRANAIELPARKSVHVRQRRPHAARERLVVGVRLERVQPHDPVGAAPQPRHLRLEHARARRGPSRRRASTTTAPRPTRRPCSRFSVGERVADARAARPVADGLGGAARARGRGRGPRSSRVMRVSRVPNANASTRRRAATQACRYWSSMRA